MKVKMNVKLLGNLNGQPYPEKGQEFEVPDNVGANLCKRGYAEPVAEKPKVEKAVPRKKPETRKG